MRCHDIVKKNWNMTRSQKPVNSNLLQKMIEYRTVNVLKFQNIFNYSCVLQKLRLKLFGYIVIKQITDNNQNFFLESIFDMFPQIFIHTSAKEFFYHFFSSTWAD